MENNVVSNVSHEELVSRGYNVDLLPRTSEQKQTSALNYFTLWMGSIHNIPSYTAVGGFLFLGLSPVNVMLAIILSALAVSAFMAYNGRAGSEYGIPFSMHLRSTYGVIGSKLPGFLRGGVAAIAWFAFQNYAGSLALQVLIGKLWPGFLEIGNGANILGLSYSGWISFLLFWACNVLIGLGGSGGLLNKFTLFLNPLIYIVFGGMTIWAISVAGGFHNILNYAAPTTPTHSPLLVYFIIITSTLSTWAAPGVSVSDFTQTAKSTKDQMIGQTASLLVGYLIFAFSSVCILIGSSIHYGVTEWNVLNIIEKWDSLPAIILAMLVFLLTTISTNATGNIIPAAYQLVALFPSKINYKKGVIIASIVSILLMPWKMMENGSSIFIFLNLIGSLLGPVAGVMIADFYVVKKQKIDINRLYMEKDDKTSPYSGVNVAAYIATGIGLVLSVSGQFIKGVTILQIFNDMSWIVGFVSASLIYLALKIKK
ncbi:putative allantoin permease [Aerococcaceae bacterium zg-ZJ1578]|uniref:allantoin permease n=1 Tax=Aerococcaceae bacterium zg-252 TaxID=2796928 RepID=UPI001A1C6695|nr:putative allantoin permease [Aerococcaceae bacterium zg-1578]